MSLTIVLQFPPRGGLTFTPELLKVQTSRNGLESEVTAKLANSSGWGLALEQPIVGKSDIRTVMTCCARVSWLENRVVFFSFENLSNAVFSVRTSPSGAVTLKLEDLRQTDPNVARKWQLEMIQVAVWA